MSVRERSTRHAAASQPRTALPRAESREPSTAGAERPTRPPRTVLLIVNPAARRGARARDEALRAFRRLGITCDVLDTRYPGHGSELARRSADRHDAVFVAGGDGTVVEVLGALAGDDTPVGILPAGTGNLLARSLGIPLRTAGAVRALVGGDELRIDLGVLADGRRFAFAAGVGVDAAMIEGTPPALKRRLGVLAYVLSAARAVFGAVFGGARFGVRATVDGEPVSSDGAAVAMIANFGAVLGGRITLGPGIRYDDGLLDLCVFSPRTLRDAVRVFWRLLRGDFRSDPCLLYRPGRRIRLATEPPRMAEADGELLERTPIEAVVEPLAATLLVPRRD